MRRESMGEEQNRELGNSRNTPARAVQVDSGRV